VIVKSKDDCKDDWSFPKNFRSLPGTREERGQPLKCENITLPKRTKGSALEM
jgi:hypothetical protein